MPTRPMTRDQAFLLPPRLDDLVPADHPVRFVAAFLEALDPGVRHEGDMDGEGDPRGAPSFHPQLLLSPISVDQRFISGICVLFPSEE